MTSRSYVNSPLVHAKRHYMAYKFASFWQQNMTKIHVQYHEIIRNLQFMKNKYMLIKVRSKSFKCHATTSLTLSFSLRHTALVFDLSRKHSFSIIIECIFFSKIVSRHDVLSKLDREFCLKHKCI